MTQIPLRLVVDHGDDTAPDAIDLRPASGAALHIHLHMASQDPPLPAPTAALAVESSGRGRSARGVTRPLLLGAAGVLIALVAFDFGARSGAGHAEALAAARASAAGLASLAAPSPAPQASAAPGELPASVQQQLAQRPVVTPPAGADTQANAAANPFGLQH
jgi:hypothetical protein